MYEHSGKFNHLDTGALTSGTARRTGIQNVTCKSDFDLILVLQERLRFHMLKQRDTVMNFRSYVKFK